MSFLPIVDRELRQAARRKSTFRTRWWVAILGMGVSFCSLLFAQMSRSGGGAGFSLFTGYAFGLSLLVGIFLTADCLSEEKREGTMGLLFLTDLKGYDVVLGKFTARSLNALYGLLALLPLAALPVLAGGVTGGEFWRMALALVNALFFSLATGVLVSSLSRDSQRAMAGTLGLILLFAAGLPVLAGIAVHFPPLVRWTPLAWVSPFYPYGYAMEPLYLFHRATFWWALLASHLTGWLLLAGAAWVLPHAWQEKGAGVQRAASAGWESWRRWGIGTPELRGRHRAKDLDTNPVLWLAGCNQAVRRSLWLIVAVWGLVCLAMTFLPLAGNAVLPVMFFAGAACSMLMRSLLAVQSCRFFAEARRSGLLEMLLYTPLSSREIIQGPSLAYQRVMLAPVVTFFGLAFLPGLLRAAWALAARDSPAWDDIAPIWITGGTVTLGLILDSLAIRWFGMWLSLKMKNPGYAAPLTILLVVILPLACCSLYCAGGLVVDLVLFLVGYTNCQDDLRRTFGGRFN